MQRIQAISQHIREGQDRGHKLVGIDGLLQLKLIAGGDRMVTIFGEPGGRDSGGGYVRNLRVRA